MGKGDKKTKKGKITRGSYGITRKKKKATVFVAPKPKAKKVAPVETEEKPKAAPKKKPAAKKTPAKKTAGKK